MAVGVQLGRIGQSGAGSHEQETPPEPMSPADSPVQTVPPPEAAAVGRPLTVSVAWLDVIDWPKPSVTTTS